LQVLNYLLLIVVYILAEQQATGLEQPIKAQSTVYTTTQLQEELDDSLLVRMYIHFMLYKYVCLS